MQKTQGSSENSKRHIVWWPILLTLLIGIFIGSTLTKGVDFVYNHTGTKPISSNQSLPNDLDYRSVEEVYDALRKNFDGELSLDDLMNGMKRGLVEAAGDPYTVFLSAEEAEEFNGEVNGTFTGIGAELIRENNLITVATPLAGFPAEKAGLKSRDIIIKIDGEDATNLTVSEAVKKIRGEKGTTVTLTVLRGDEQLELTIVRDTITVPSVTSEIKDGIGYLTITRFSKDTTELSRKAANEFKDQNVRGVVVDLRNNPGGFLDQAVTTASIWLPKDTIVVEEKRDGQTESLERAVGDPTLIGIPTVVLINGGSASASEILAGALKDNKAAVLVGETSFGKGSVQQVQPFSNESALKVTIAKWYTPSGVNINEEGIKPDKEVTISEDDVKNDRDPQKDAATSQI